MNRTETNSSASQKAGTRYSFQLGSGDIWYTVSCTKQKGILSALGCPSCWKRGITKTATLDDELARRLACRVDLRIQ